MSNATRQVIGSANVFNFRLLYICVYFFLGVFTVFLGLLNESIPVYFFPYFFVVIFLIIISQYFFFEDKIVSLMFLFNCSYFLFFGGRFLSYLFLSGDDAFFDLYFMARFKANDIEKINAFVFSSVFIIFFNLGGLFINSYKYSKMESLYLWNSKFLDSFLLIIFVLIFYLCVVDQLSIAVATFNDGYLARYDGKSEQYDVGGSLKYSLFYVFFGLIISQAKLKLVKFLAYLFYFIFSLSVLASGARGIFVSSLLVGFWILGMHYKIKLWHLFIFIFFVLFLMLFGMGLTARGDVTVEGGLLDKVSTLLYDQGTTLGVVSYVLTIDIDSYSNWAWLSSFIPGVSFIASLVEGRGLYLNEISFPGYADFYANEEMFNAGFGMGWSIVLSFYIFSKSNIYLFILLSFSFGCFLKYLESKAMQNRVILGMLLTIAGKVLFVVRSDLSTVIPLAIYYFVVLSLFSFFLFFLRNEKKQF